MRDYLDDYISTLTKKRRERIYDLLRESRVGKEQLDSIAARLDEQSDFTPLSLREFEESSRVRRRIFVENLTEIRNRLRELYRTSNLVSLLVNSHSSMLSAEFGEIEQELNSLEKVIDNYAFLMSDRQAYDYAYMESFNDTRQRETRLGNYPDRNGISFGPAEMARVDRGQGSLVMPEGENRSFGLSASVIDSNCNAFLIEETDINKIFDNQHETAWRVKIQAPGPIVAPLSQDLFGSVGAQNLIEFKLTEATPLSFITFDPHSHKSPEILRIILFVSDDDMEGTDVLSDKLRLNHRQTVYFPLQHVYKMHVLMNQPSYHRTMKDRHREEDRYAEILNDIRVTRRGAVGPVRNIVDSSLFESTHDNIVDPHFTLTDAIPVSDYPAHRGPFSAEIYMLTQYYDFVAPWRTMHSMKTHLLLDMVRRMGLDDLYREYAPSLDLEPDILQADSPEYNELYNYYYAFGLKGFRTGVHAPAHRAIYVSKPIPAPGDPKEVRMKVKDKNFIDTNLVQKEIINNPQLTSIEYSVSNRPNPIKEDDWVPILPKNVNTVESERLFVDSNFNAFFRFPADPAGVFVIYKNGLVFDPIDTDNYIYRNNRFVGVKIPSALFAEQDIFTCSYTPSHNRSTVNFSDFGFEHTPLTTAFDDSGVGETFQGTGNNNVVTLDYPPFIRESGLSDGIYSPVTVQLSDGTTAVNLTDYLEGDHDSFPEDDHYYFLHVNNILSFNRPIRQPFTVYYQYLQSHVRFRVVLRVNTESLLSPAVESIHVKAKLHQPFSRSV